MSKEIVFEKRSDFRKWLEQTDMNSEGVWLIFRKTKSITSITASEALEEALCFGWIDGLIKSIDDEKYKKYFAPRRKGSKWSAKNKEIIARLIKDNQVEKRKQDTEACGCQELFNPVVVLYSLKNIACKLCIEE